MSILEIDKKNIWHPFTQMKTSPAPINIVSGKGAKIFDENGNEYIDAISSWWVNIHGHCNETIQKAILKQIQKLEHVIFAGFTHENAALLSEKLISILPENQNKIFFSDNGSTAVEVALKMTIQYWKNQNIQRNGFIAFEDSYHGDTLGAMSVGSRSVFTDAFSGYMFESYHAPLPSEENIDSVMTQLENIIQEKKPAGFIFEPIVLGAGGMRMYEPKFLDMIIELCRKNDIIIIADEVMTGFGRLGKTFASDYLTNKPDIICLSKGITGGFLPMGVTSCAKYIYDIFYSDDITKTFFHGHSYTANPISCAAANASIDLLLSEKCQNNIEQIMNLHNEFIQILKNNDKIKNIRQKGTILAFDINTSDNEGYTNQIKNILYDYYIKNGVLLRPLGNVIYILPPYCITKDELNRVYEIINLSLKII
ncbi:MAG: adenosylmethionine--8-amino-7-oxononanoate transaminase [Spirochaetia bacterium]|nr:adenosylmethionine--8-amino-7-oxononanoate transaminase [Spirochaetia bacterium]